MNINEIVIPPRLRKEMGDIDQLAASIKDNGLIQPIVLVKELELMAGVDELLETAIILIAGHRRLQALIKLGINELEYGVHFIWRDDLAKDEYRKTAVELEENLRRKNMTWSEEVAGKQRLLETYQRIYGAPVPGQPTRSVQQGLKPGGFGVRTLAKLLNENVATTSQDLEMAALITQLPILKNEPSREAAKRRLELALKIQRNQGLPNIAKPLQYKILVECDNEA